MEPPVIKQTTRIYILNALHIMLQVPHSPQVHKPSAHLYIHVHVHIAFMSAVRVNAYQGNMKPCMLGSWIPGSIWSEIHVHVCVQ